MNGLHKRKFRTSRIEEDIVQLDFKVSFLYTKKSEATDERRQSKRNRKIKGKKGTRKPPLVYNPWKMISQTHGSKHGTHFLLRMRLL